MSCIQTTVVAAPGCGVQWLTTTVTIETMMMMNLRNMLDGSRCVRSTSLWNY